MFDFLKGLRYKRSECLLCMGHMVMPISFFFSTLQLQRKLIPNKFLLQQTSPVRNLTAGAKISCPSTSRCYSSIRPGPSAISLWTSTAIPRALPRPHSLVWTPSRSITTAMIIRSQISWGKYWGTTPVPDGCYSIIRSCFLVTSRLK